MRTRKIMILAVLAGVVGCINEATAQDSILDRQTAMFRRNVGSPEEQREQFPPHRIAGNVYYVGSNSLAAFLIATPDGHILINTNWEDGVPNLRASVEDLGFDFEDIEIILGSHAHGDHMQGGFFRMAKPSRSAVQRWLRGVRRAIPRAVQPGR